MPKIPPKVKEIIPPLMTSDAGSFARATIVERKPQIIRQVMEDNAYPESVLQALEDFRLEISSSMIQPVQEEIPDARFWNEQLSSFSGSTWLQVPWYFAETFFYRRLLEATKYFQPGALFRQDPFGKQKQDSIFTAIQWFEKAWAHFSEIDREVQFAALLHSSLWGNRADLSNYTVEEQAQGGLAALQERHLILIDHTDEIHQKLKNGLNRLDFINDNVGKELLFDLALADHILTSGYAKQIVFRLKDRPFFVSDAMPSDVFTTVDQLRQARSQPVQLLGARLQEHLTRCQLVLTPDAFFTSCLMFRQMPAYLSESLALADLVILKGDVNYRRLLDDLHWPHNTKMERVTRYFPTSFAAIRTLKGEIMVGLTAKEADTLAKEDRSWLINGKRGIIQLVSKQKGD